MAIRRIRRPRPQSTLSLECPKTLLAELDEYVAWARAHGAAGVTRSAVMRDALRITLSERVEARNAFEALSSVHPERSHFLLTAFGIRPPRKVGSLECSVIHNPPPPSPSPPPRHKRNRP